MDKDTKPIVRAATKAGWIFPCPKGAGRTEGAHNQQWLCCPHDGDDHCELPVYSTPRKGQPNVLKRYLRKCPHGFRIVL